MPRLLLMSNSTMPGTPFFSWPQPFVKQFLTETAQEIVFIPFAGVTLSFDEYADVVKGAFEQMEMRVKSVHRESDPAALVKSASAIVIGGGNTFALLSRLYQHGLLEIIRQKVATGTPFVGWSAGANMACPTLMTTNDMPIVQPPSFEALNLVPFQINPHYTDYKQAGHGGETRRQRIEEFLMLNQGKKVVGLPEGMLIHKEGSILTLRGEGNARIFEHNKPVFELPAGEDVSFLLR